MHTRSSRSATPEGFRRAGHSAVEWSAAYMENVGEYPVLSRLSPGDVAARLPDSPPESGEPWEAVMADLDEVVMPGVPHWQSPDFFAYFPANASGPSILGDLISSGLGVQGMLWAPSPALTEVETKELDWLVEMCGLPDRFSSK